MPYATNFCRCGCGGYTQREFCPGHDARHRGNLLRTARMSDAFRIHGEAPYNISSEAYAAYWELATRGWLPSQHGTRRTTSNRQQRRTPSNVFTPSANTPAVAVAFSGWQTAIATDRTFGVEFEIIPATTGEHMALANRIINEFANRGLIIVREGYNHRTSQYWKIVEDGSVSSNPSTYTRDGLEVVSPVLCGEAGFQEMKTACEALEAAGAKVNRTCGTHVHIGTSGMTENQILKAARVYAINQTYFDQMVSPSRRGNTYCQPLSRTDTDRLQVATTISTGQTDERYHTVNLHAYWRHKTLEFRQHQGTIEYRKIAAWVRLVMAVTNLATTVDADELAVAPVFTSLTEMFDVLGTSEVDRGFFAGRIQQLAAPVRTARQTATV